VAGLAMLRQMMIAVPVFVIAVALAQRPERLITIGRDAAELIGRIPGVSLLFGPIEWLNGTKHAQLWIGSNEVGFDLVERLQSLGIATLQAIVIISIFQILASPVLGFRAWRTGSPTWFVAAVGELVFALLLLYGLYLIVSGSHDQLLGSGGDWTGGWALTGLVGGGTWLLSKLVLLAKSPAATRIFGVIMTLFFAATMVGAVIAIFSVEDLPDAEVAYVVIWAGAIVLYRLASSRWQNWDRLEQEIAKEPIAHRAVNRWPAYLGAAGLLVVVAGASIAVLYTPADLAPIHVGIAPVSDLEVPAAFAALGLVLFFLSYLIGGKVSQSGRDPIAAPDPVESARW
jgi:hypothetical protein